MRRAALEESFMQRKSHHGGLTGVIIDPHYEESATQCGSYCNPLDSVWVVWKRPIERYGYGIWKCDTSDVNAFKKNGGDRRMGARTHLCVPIGAHMGRPQIHHETKRGLDRGLVSVLCSLHYDGWLTYGITNKVWAFLPCTNPAETGSNM
ncbi:hypothetical protein BGY98DRAFT_977980 [Russula aff. rugulosa BPL654]|nr:hypothetical protein BGY98DRAFT_977980 [Russula aff. rugulosa BPL654]